MSAPVLQVGGVSKRFGRTLALDQVSFEASGGQVHAVLGENGAGKSTLMHLLAGVLSADGGSIRLAGAPYAPRGPAAARAAGVMMVHQEPQLCAHLTVAENISLGAEPLRAALVDRRAQRRVAVRTLEQVCGRRDSAAISPDDTVSRLGAGDRQLVALARALALPGCRVLILDEPTSSLGVEDVDRLFVAVAAARARGLCVLYISHFLEEVERIADRFTVLRDGRVAGVGAISEVTGSDLVRLMVGAEVEALFPRTRRSPGEVVLDVEQLSGRHKPVAASFQLRAGEVLGVAGLVGSGRTELLRAIFGLDQVRGGRLRVAATAGAAPPARRLAQGVGLLSEDRRLEGLARGMSIADNITLSKLAPLGAMGLVFPARQRRAARQWADSLHIVCHELSQPVSALSGGNQQKVAFARLLHHDARILLLDEPTRGIDVASRAQIYRLIDQLAAAGKAVLLVSSYLPELLGVCDRIAVMRRGRLGPARPVAELDKHRLMMEATGA